MFCEGDLVDVASRTTPGINKRGGRGRITSVNEVDKTFNIRYILGGKEAGVESKFIVKVDLNQDVGGRTSRRGKEMNETSAGAVDPSSSSSSSSSKPTNTGKRVKPMKFAVDDLVDVKSRTTPGINKRGGRGRIVVTHPTEGTYDVKYLLGRSQEKHVDEVYITKVDTSEESQKNLRTIRQTPAKVSKKSIPAPNTVSSSFKSEKSSAQKPKKNQTSKPPIAPIQSQFKKGDTVRVERRMGPGMNKPGGVGIVLRVFSSSTVPYQTKVQPMYDIKYVVNGGSEKNVPESIVHAVEEVSSSRRHPKVRVQNKRKLHDTEQPDHSSSSSSALPATLKPEKKNE